MTDIDTLRADYEAAEQKAQKLMAEKDAAMDDIRSHYGDALRAANDEAAAAQKALCDAEAAAALVGRDDAETVAANLGLTLPE